MPYHPHPIGGGSIINHDRMRPVSARRRAMQRIVGNLKFTKVQIGDPDLNTLTEHVDLLA
jgi:hypothetical protein